MSSLLRLKSAKKLQDIPVVHFVWESSINIYNTVKSLNILTLYAFLTLENSFKLALKAVTPVIHKFEGQIEAVDSFACIALEKLQDTVPLIKVTPEEALTSTSQVILENGLVQKSLNVVDKTLYLAEKAVTVIPTIQVEDVSDLQGSEREKKDAIDVLSSIQKFYALTTTPLTMMRQFLHQRRENVKHLQVASDVKVTSQRRKTLEELTKPLGFFEKLFFLPVQGLHSIGQYAQKRSELKMLEDPEIDVDDKVKYKKLQDAESREIEELNFSNSDDATDSETEEINKPKDIINKNNKPRTSDKKHKKIVNSSSSSNVSKNCKFISDTNKKKLTIKDSGNKVISSNKKAVSPTNASSASNSKRLSLSANPFSSNAKNTTAISNAICPSPISSPRSNKAKRLNTLSSNITASLSDHEHIQGTTKVNATDSDKHKNNTDKKLLKNELHKKNDAKKSNINTALSTKCSEQKSLVHNAKNQRTISTAKNNNFDNFQEENINKTTSSMTVRTINQNPMKAGDRRSVSEISETVAKLNSRNAFEKSKVSSSDQKKILKRRSFT